MNLFKGLKKKPDGTGGKHSEPNTAACSQDLSSINGFDYERLQLPVKCGPPLTLYEYQESFDIKEFLKIWNVLYPPTHQYTGDLIEYQLEKIDQMRKRLDSLPLCLEAPVTKARKWYKFWVSEPVDNIRVEELFWCTELLLFRFARSYKYDVDLAFKMLTKTLGWRRERDPSNMNFLQFAQIIDDGLIYRKGYDCTGRLLVYFRPANETIVDRELQARCLFYFLERAAQSTMVEYGNDKVYAIVDLKDWSLSKLPKLELVLETIRAMSEHYTDLLHEVLVVDPPMFMDPLFAMIRAILDHETAKKMVVKSRGQKLEKYLRSFIPDEFLETSLGGACDHIYSHEEYTSNEVSQSEEFAAIRDSWLEKNRDGILQSKAPKAEPDPTPVASTPSNEL